jgi:signal transduction histidine kinase
MVLIIGAAFLTFALWQAVLHVWGLHGPHIHLVALIVEMTVVVIIVMVALHMARAQEPSDKDKVVAELSAALMEHLRPEERELVCRAAAEGGEVIDLVEELDALERVAEVGQTASVHTPFISVIEAVVGSVRAAAQEKEVELQVDLTTDLPPPEARSDQVVELLVELLSSGIGRVPSGGVVKLTARRAAEPNLLQLSIRCSSPVTDGEPAPLPEGPHRGERCRMLVEALGGTMREEAVPGGLEVTFTLPARESR